MCAEFFPPGLLGSTPTGFLFEAPAVSATAALPELTSAPWGNFGGVPWMGGWSPQKTVERQLLVRPAAVATRGIHGQKWCPTTSNCAQGVVRDVMTYPQPQQPPQKSIFVVPSQKSNQPQHILFRSQLNSSRPPMKAALKAPSLQTTAYRLAQ
ncbi:hypothetical protein PGT21_024321 [Puccinia graminis f. sp. tritici]|uniref:Uncharacterized protein n=1 Tax=Puccinia graminis f. sp. tritici TaxID=56615 RepID=A0A5B0MFR2_PUCGR|nr:hypothetical protein PGT21_024321 [Puccinia graminis f. sp. tritici]